MGSIVKKLIITVAGAAASYYATKMVANALERKPLKTRVRETKEKAVDMKNSAIGKAHAMKNGAASKVSSLIEEKDQDQKDL